MTKWIVTYTEKKYERIEAGSAAGARRGFLENHTIRIDGNAYPDNSLKILGVQKLERCPAGKHWTVKGTKCMECELELDMGAD